MKPSETSIRRWLEADRLPADLYELLGRRRFDPDQSALLAATRAAHRELLPYQNHPDAAKARRALALLIELGRAEDVLTHANKMRAYHEQLLDRLREAYGRLPGPAEDVWTLAHLQGWLSGVAGVHPQAVAAVAQSLLPPLSAQPKKP